MARRAFPTRGRKIDFKQWDAAPGIITEASTTGNVLSGSLAFSIPATILRWRSYFSVMFDETAQVGDRGIYTYAIGVFSTDAVAAAEVPDPAAEPEYPWVFWTEMRLDAFQTLGPTGGWGSQAQRYEVDSKAMRKIKPGESLVALIQVTNLAGAPNALIDMAQLRVLIGT